MMENEMDKKLNVLDISITRAHDRLQFGIFRKPMAMDTHMLIHSNSCHPVEHKMSGINYLTNRLTKYPITDHSRHIEIGAIEHMLKANNYQYFNLYEKI
jgi:hypothetical protein